MSDRGVQSIAFWILVALRLVFGLGFIKGGLAGSASWVSISRSARTSCPTSATFSGFGGTDEDVVRALSGFLLRHQVSLLVSEMFEELLAPV